MNEEAFADATRPTPRVILRLLMLDYSIGHELFLTARRNPLLFLAAKDFADLPDEAQRLAVCEAALVCSQPWKSLKLRQRWLRIWGWLIRKEDFAAAAAEFLAYRAAGSRCPRIADPWAADEEPAEKGRALGSPWHARMINFLRGQGIPNDEVMDYPLGKATFEFFAHMEDESRVKVENADERETREGVERLEAEARAEALHQKGATCPA
jgi:hypothetical protein